MILYKNKINILLNPLSLDKKWQVQLGEGNLGILNEIKETKSRLCQIK